MAKIAGTRVALILAVALNLIPLAYTGLLLAPGTVAGAGGDDARLRFIAAHTSVWVAGWTMWMGGSLGLLLSIWALARVFADRSAAGVLLHLAVPMATIAATADMIGDSLQVGALPTIAAYYVALPVTSDSTTIRFLFHLCDRLITVLSGVVGNTGYFVAGALVTIALARVANFPTWIIWLGALAWLVTLAATPAAYYLDSVLPMIIPVVVAAALFLYSAWLGAILLWGLSPGRPVPGDVRLNRDR